MECAELLEKWLTFASTGRQFQDTQHDLCYVLVDSFRILSLDVLAVAFLADDSSSRNTAMIG